MARRKFLATAILVGSFFILSGMAMDAPETCATGSAWGGIKINEVHPFTASDDWVELFNASDECVALDGLAISDGAANTKTLTGNITAGDWLLADFNNWLNKTGDTVNLKNGEMILDTFTYTGDDSDCGDCAFARFPDGAGEWRLTVSTTPGLANIITPWITGPTTTPPDEPPTSTPATDTSTLWAALRLNEIMPDPEGGYEWVEIYNPSTSSLDLAGGYFCDSRGATSSYACKNLSGEIAAGSWKIATSSGYLNNDGDAVYLKNPEGNIVDEAAYGEGGSYAAPGKGRSLARAGDGMGNWAITTASTPASANTIVSPPPPASGGSSAYTASANSAETSDWSDAQVILNELLPDPDGEDDEEFIELKNLSANLIDITGWKLGDKTKTFTLSGTMAAGEIRAWTRAVTGIALNNSTAEEVRIMTPDGAVAASTTYDKAPTGQSFSRAESGNWLWTETPTPGKENIFTYSTTAEKTDVAKTVGLIWKIKRPTRVKAGEKTEFDASGSMDPRGGRISFAWEMAEGALVNGTKIEYYFTATGTREIIVHATSTAGTADDYRFKIMVFSTSTVGQDVVIVGVFANAGEDNEYIQIQNTASSSIDLSNWKLFYKNKTYTLPASTTAMSGATLTFYDVVTGFALNNTGGEVELRTPDDILADIAVFDKSKTGEMAALKKDGADAPDETKTATSSGARATGVKYSPYAGLVNIAQARGLSKDTRVKVRGTVIALPGTFGSQYFYIADATGGIQIYQYKKDFPPVAVGDMVEVAGAISEASGIKRVRAAGQSDIDILSIDGNPSSTPCALEELNEDRAGQLVSAKGEITEMKTNYFYLDDGTSEIAVYLKQGAKIDKQKYREGETVTVTGVLEQNANGEWQIWPRSPDDIQNLGISIDALDKKIAAAENKQKATAEKYLTATAGGISALLLGFFAKLRGALIKNTAKRVASAALSIFKKG